MYRSILDLEPTGGFHRNHVTTQRGTHIAGMRDDKETKTGDAFKKFACGQRQEVEWALEVFFSLFFLNRRERNVFKT